MFFSRTRWKNCSHQLSCGFALVIEVQRGSLSPTCLYLATASGWRAKFRFLLLPTRVCISDPSDLLKGAPRPHRSPSRCQAAWTCPSPVVSTTDVGIGTRLLAGCTTGAMAVTFAQPTDVVKVRFQAQIRLPDSGSVKRYNSTLEAYRTIAREEGVKGLWKGETKF